MARISSLNCLSCRNPYQTPHSLNPPPFSLKTPFFSLKRASSDPLPKIGSEPLLKNLTKSMRDAKRLPHRAESWARNGLTPEYCGKKAPRAMRAMRGKTLETVPFQPYFGCTESFLKVLSNEYCQATRTMRVKRGVTVPLQPYFGFH